MKKPTIQACMLVASVVACERAAVAQDTFVFQREIQASGAAPGVDVKFLKIAPGPQEIGLMAVEPFEATRAVIDAPYTADAVTDVTQVLPDGNRIERSTSAAVARDSRGRVRREHQGMMLGALQAAPSPVPLVSISDPASGSHVTLNQERRLAHRLRMPTFDVPVPGPGGGDIRTEQLGAQEIEGVRAEGTRTTMTVPAGAIGNQFPIETVSERWYSPDLQVVVLTRRSDPRFGDTVYRLTNILRAEPPADLFEVPSDYQIEDLAPGQR